MMVWLAPQAAYAKDMNLIVTLDRAALQRRIERMFPIVREGELVAVRLYHPQVIMTGHSDRIGLRMRVDSTAAEQFSVSGLATVDGVLRFASDTGEFYLDDASVRELQIDGVPALYAEQIRQLAAGVVRDLLRDRPIYTLGQTGESKRIMGSEVKSISVRDGKLVVELAMP
jgi:Protein of unknown function (DUF1439)